VTIDVCLACGYPTVGPDLCFYCRPVVTNMMLSVEHKVMSDIPLVAVRHQAPPFSVISRTTAK
jgi:hypothetical protein